MLPSATVFTSIVCPVDFSDHSVRALNLAIDVSELTDAHLTVVHVVDGFLASAAEATGNADTVADQTQQELRDLMKRVAASRPRVPNHLGISVVIGDPAAEILNQVKECEADLIVMGTQGLEGTKRLVFGSTTERVLREATVPVLAVPAPPENENET